MTTTPRRKPIRAIRRDLKLIDGAIRFEPLAEDAATEESPAYRIWEHDPDLTSFEGLSTDYLEVDELKDLVADDPAAVFEIPPEITAGDIWEVLGDERTGPLRRLQQIRGIDALGWYVTFHQERYQHGIHIPVEGILMLSAQLARSGKVKLPLSRVIELSYQAILRHELFHFETDCMIANWELSSGSPVYWNVQEQFRNNAGYIEHEEALANAYMLRGFKHPTASRRNSPGMYQALRQFCEAQPAGYRLGPELAVSRDVYLNNCRNQSASYQYVSRGSWEIPSSFDSLLLYNDPVRVDWTRCPILVFDQNQILPALGIQLSYFQSISYIAESDLFQRRIRKLGAKIQEKWRKRKDALSASTSLRSLDFKRWSPAGPDWYSVRVDGNHRAHLRYDRSDTTWIAESIGNHKEMGHG